MNNNFVVSIPKELKNIKSKLIFGLTKRQLVGFGIAILLSIPVFLFLKVFSPEVAMYGLFFTALPVIFATIFSKDGMPAETWIKIFIEYKYINPPKRYYKVSKKNEKLAKERRMFSAKPKVRKEKSLSNT